MWEEPGERKMFHGQWFSRGSDTVLGEAGDPCELFAVDQCDDNPLGAIMDKVKLEFRPTPENWSMLGGAEVEEGEEGGDGRSFFYQKWYDSEKARFENPPDLSFLPTGLMDIPCPQYCLSCQRNKVREESLMPNPEGDSLSVSKSEGKVKYSSFSLCNVPYRTGDCVYLPPDCYHFPVKPHTTPKKHKKETSTDVDEEKYPEIYRKSVYVKGSNLDVPKPFQIGRIVEIFMRRPSGKLAMDPELHILVNMFYR